MTAVRQDSAPKFDMRGDVTPLASEFEIRQGVVSTLSVDVVDLKETSSSAGDADPTVAVPDEIPQLTHISGVGGVVPDPAFPIMEIKRGPTKFMAPTLHQLSAAIAGNHGVPIEGSKALSVVCSTGTRAESTLSNSAGFAGDCFPAPFAVKGGGLIDALLSSFDAHSRGGGA